ncbi:MAG: carboxypeptidase regulatory-like domain-containing protein, partial [Acidobacteria bacterium]|nr:carboxypeptidase regulatory-like domain-containing protein [Acidobacteriota bacterium]
MMRKLFVAAGLLVSLALCTRAFGQSTYARVSGTIEDATGALLPGVSVTATNNATGVVTTVVSNESGAYNFPSLLPGVYKVSAELPGFPTRAYTDVQLGNAQQVRLNFTLSVATVATGIEVTIAADTLLATSSSSVGEVLTEQRVQDMPIVGNNVLDFFRLLPGARIDANGVTGTFAGVSADKVNIQRDGVDASGSAYWVQAGAQSATFINPDLVGEMRMILAPVDAEFGRGNAQVQFLTRSGTNQFKGSLVWSARNTALDANTWNNNNDIDPKTGEWKPTKPDWVNAHQ